MSLAPDHVYFIPTLRCDLDCPYCFQKDMPPLEETLDLAAWQGVIEQVKAFGSTIEVMGGELFLFRPIVDVLRAVKHAGLPVVIITNGTLLRHRADELVDLGLDGLYVSLDGPSDVHNPVRGHPRSYELAVAGLVRVLERRGTNRRPVVQVFCAISGFTVGRLQEHAEAMVRLGVDRLVLNALIGLPPDEVRAQSVALQDRFGVDENLCPAIHESDMPAIDTRALRAELDRVAAAVPRKRLAIDPPDLARRPAVYLGRDATPFRSRACVSAYRDMWIYPNGDVTACARMNELVMGNVLTEDLASIWNGPRYRAFRHQLRTEGLMPVCGRCVR
jgi:MoaA/NifB/PqqE/SkfB family radical SAM enzyme